jgi:hypothetical protein
MTFKKFCFDFLAKYRTDHRCDFIWEALEDKDFPWECDVAYGVYYLEAEKANPKCVQCYEDLQEMYGSGLTF